MKLWRVLTLGLVGATLALSGCWGKGCGSTRAIPPVSDIADKATSLLGKPRLPDISTGLGTLDWVIGLSFLAAFLCIVATVVVGFIGGIASATFRRGAAIFVGCGVGGVVMKAITVALADWAARHTYIVGGIAGIAGLIFVALYAWGHRNWLERLLGVDLDRDGDIGEDGVQRINGAIPLPPVPPERLGGDEAARSNGAG